MPRQQQKMLRACSTSAKSLATDWVRVKESEASCRLKGFICAPSIKSKILMPKRDIQRYKTQIAETRATSNATPNNKIETSNKLENSYRERTVPRWALDRRFQCRSVTPLSWCALLCDVPIPRRSTVAQQPRTRHFA